MQPFESVAESFSRRDFLSWTAHGLGSAAFASLLFRDGALSAAATSPEAADPWPHHTAPARRAIHICLCGGLSQVDSFDYKPELERFHGQKYGDINTADVFFGKIGLLRKGDWPFQVLRTTASTRSAAGIAIIVSGSSSGM